MLGESIEDFSVLRICSYLNKGHLKSEFNLVVCCVKIFRALIFSLIYPYQISKLDFSKYAHICVCVHMHIHIYLHESGRKIKEYDY